MIHPYTHLNLVVLYRIDELYPVFGKGDMLPGGPNDEHPPRLSPLVGLTLG